MVPNTNEKATEGSPHLPACTQRAVKTGDALQTLLPALSTPVSWCMGLCTGFPAGVPATSAEQMSALACRCPSQRRMCRRTLNTST